MSSFSTRLRGLIDFLEPLHHLTDARMATFYLDNLWAECFPETMAPNPEISENQEQVYGDLLMYCEMLHSAAPHHLKLREPRNCFEDLARTSFLQIQETENLAANRKKHSFLNELETGNNGHTMLMMSRKKLAEVQTMSELIAELCQNWNLHNVIDFGCGKGYLSAMLTLRHNINVTGLESNEATISSAMSRFRKISKQWPGLKRRLTAPENVAKETPGTFSILPCTVRQDLNTDSCLGDSEYYLLCGLHTCGSLGNAIAEVFLRNERSVGLCFVGCCYHYMDEEFDRRRPSEGRCTFPLSAYLRQREFCFGKNTRMLASQSIDRTMREGRHRLDISARSLFFRALLQILLVRSASRDTSHKLNPSDLDEVRVGRIPVDLQMSFEEYADKAREICGFPASVSVPECEEIFHQFKSAEVHMKIVNLLRILLGAGVEQVMLLDRLCYLEEQEGVAEVSLVSMFDPVVSPRSWAICARKAKQSVKQS